MWYNIIRRQGKPKRHTKIRKANLQGSIAQLGEHLPYKQRVIGSSPIVSINLHSKLNMAW